MVINAAYGQAIKAVYSGTVVFSDYLRGYGLVILLDHGKGDMTLYGFNQSLLKKEGDKISAGKPLRLQETLVVSQKPHFISKSGATVRLKIPELGLLDNENPIGHKIFPL